MDEQDQPSREIREHLRLRIGKWEAGLPPEGVSLGTLGAGVSQRALSLVGTLLARAVTQLLPEVQLRSKPTWGTYIDVLHKHGPGRELVCLGAERALVTSDEIALLERLRDQRNRIAHPEEADFVDPSGIGALGSGAIRSILADCRAVTDLPLFDELVCREEGAESR
jgi:hypothetical protein